MMNKVHMVLSLFKLSKQDLKYFIPILLTIIICDLVSKSFTFSLPLSGYYVCNFINILKVKNYGISFGLFNENPDIAIYFIVIFDILIMLYLLYCFQTKNTYTHHIPFIIALCLIFGGAVGNLFDRVYYGYVRDFIDIHLSEHHWPCFNVADICVCIGVGILVVCELFFKKNNKLS